MPPDIDASELSYEEWFTLWAMFGMKPDAKLTDVNEWQRRSMGLPKPQQAALVRQGLAQLIARGALEPEKDAAGNPVIDPATKQPVWRGVGRIVSRVREHKPVVGKGN